MKHSRAESQGSRRPTLLVVTREAGLYAAITVAFRRYIDVEAAPTPAAALCRVSQRRHEFLLLDVREADHCMPLLITRVGAATPTCRVIVIASDAQNEVLRTLAALPISGLVQRSVLFSELERILAALLSVGTPRAPAGPGRLTKYVAKVFDILAREYRDSITRAALAKAICLSPSHLAFKVRQETGMSLTECLTRIRIEAVKFHLTHSDAKLQAISHDTGFCDASHLARVFQKYGYPRPTTYRQRHTASLSPLPQRASA